MEKNEEGYFRRVRENDDLLFCYDRIGIRTRLTITIGSAGKNAISISLKVTTIVRMWISKLYKCILKYGEI